jgi:hypothetical protein
MKNIAQWKSSAERHAVRNPTGFKVRNTYCVLLDFIHREDWQGACHASSTVFFSLLAAQGIESDICLGEMSFGKVYFDHSWVEVNGEIYDTAISNTLLSDVYFPPVFRGLDLSTIQPTLLRYGTSGQGYDENAQWIRSVSVPDYMSRFPNHPQGLFGITKLIAKSAGIRVNLATVEKCAARATWKERP